MVISKKGEVGSAYLSRGSTVESPRGEDHAHPLRRCDADKTADAAVWQALVNFFTKFFYRQNLRIFGEKQHNGETIAERGDFRRAQEWLVVSMKTSAEKFAVDQVLWLSIRRR